MAHFGKRSRQNLRCMAGAVFCCGVLTSCTTLYRQEGNRFVLPKYHVSVIPPEGWDVGTRIPGEYLPEFRLDQKYVWIQGEVVDLAFTNREKHAVISLRGRTKSFRSSQLPGLRLCGSVHATYESAEEAAATMHDISGFTAKYKRPVGSRAAPTKIAMEEHLLRNGKRNLACEETVFVLAIDEKKVAYVEVFLVADCSCIREMRPIQRALIHSLARWDPPGESPPQGEWRLLRPLPPVKDNEPPSLESPQLDKGIDKKWL